MFCSKQAMLGLSKSISGFDPQSIGSCQLWLDAADTGTMNSTPTVTTWNDKSGNGNNMTGTATWSGSNMTFNGSTQAFSNTGFVFPSNAYSMFAVYSNTTAPAAAAYMNVVYGNGGYPMLGTYDTGKYVTARSVAANTGGLGTTGTANPNGWAAQIASTANDYGRGVATDSSGNVFVTGYYGAALTLYNTGGTTGASLAFTGGTDVFLAKYSSAGSVLWAAQITGTTTSGDAGYGVATDSSGNVFVTGYYSAALTLYNTGGGTGATLAFTGGNDVFLAKYSSAGSVLWAAQITGTTTSSDVGYGVATDSSGNVFVTGVYGAALTLYNTGGGTGATLPFTGGYDAFLAKYSSAGSVVWATRIASTGYDYGYGVTTDSSGNVFVTGYYSAALTLYNTGGGTGATLAFTGGNDAFLVKYSSAGSVVWATRMTGTTTSSDLGYGVATDSSGNVFVTGQYGTALTLYNTGGGTGATLAGTSDVFLAKYSSAGSVVWATRMAGTQGDQPWGVATDSSGNVFVTGTYNSSTLRLYNTDGTTSTALGNVGLYNVEGFLAKYSSAGSVVWAASIGAIAALGNTPYAVATDSSGNVFVTGSYGAAFTTYNANGGTGATLPVTGGIDCFLAKYSPNGFITGTTTIYSGFFSASSTTLVSALYTPSTVSPFVNGTTFQTITGTTAAATGLFIGGPSNYFNGSLAELLIYASTLSTSQRQAVEGYLTWKWNLRSSFLVTHPLYATPPFMQAFRPIDITGCRLWMDAADTSTMNSSTTVTSWSDKSGNGNNMTGTATYSGGTMTFNGTNQAFSNTGFVFPNTAYSMFAVYSNTTAPAAAAYMNVVYGNGGYPMVGTYDTGKLVSARSLSTNTGAVNTAGGWAAQIAGTTTSSDVGQGVATDSSGNVYVTGQYGAALTLYNTGGTTGASLVFTGGTDVFLAKYSSAGSVLWAAQITGTTTSSDLGYGVATDSSGNVFVTGYYTAALTLYNTGGGTGATLAFTGGLDAFLAKYSSAGSVLWAAQIAGTTTSSDIGYAVATDSSGNVFVTGQYGAALTLYNTGGTTGASLVFTGGTDVFLAKYSSAGSVLWAAQITGTTTSGDLGYGVATDSSGNVFVTGYYSAAATVYDSTGGSSGSLAFTGGADAFLAKYSSGGGVVWATRIAGTGSDIGQAVATDSSGNVFVTGWYGAAVTLYNSDTTTGATLAYSGGQDVFLAKYSPAGAVVWATRIAGTSNDIGYAVATDSSGNVFVTGQYGAALTLYNTGGGTGATLAFTGGNDVFLAKYSSAGSVVWATRITGTTTSDDRGYAVATDSSGNVFVTGSYAAAVTLYNSDTTTGATLAFTGGIDAFLVKYSSDGFILKTVPASSNVLVSGTYTPSTFSPFINGSTALGLSGTTAAATGLFIGGPSNYFNGSLSELVIYAATLTTAQRQLLEGYLAKKWGLNSSLISTQPYKTYAFPITSTVSSNFTIS